MFRSIRPNKAAYSKARNGSSKTRSGKTRSSKQRAGKIQLLLTIAPVALGLMSQYRERQKTKRGRFYKPRKRERAFDFVLDQANRRFGAGQSRRGRKR